MREYGDNPDVGGASQGAGPEQTVGRQLFVAIAVGAVVLTSVMFLMVLAVMQAPPSVIGDSSFQPADASPADYARHIAVEESVLQVVTGARGDRELEITGRVRNTGSSAVKAADINCRCITVSGGEALFKLPLIVDTRLDEVGDGWLMPLSSREFNLRIGRFPKNIEPEASRIEVTNVSVQSL